MIMATFDPDQFLNMTMDALDFQFMIGDVRDFLEFSEDSIALQHKQEVAAHEQQDFGDDHEYEHHLAKGIEHRFLISLPLRVRYSALISFVTSVEWSMKYLKKATGPLVGAKAQGINEAVHVLSTLCNVVKHDARDVIATYEALVTLRNCIVHTGGIVEGYQYKDDLPAAAAAVPGVTLESCYFFGPQVCIARSALVQPIDRTEKLALTLHRLLRDGHHIR